MIETLKRTKFTVLMMIVMVAMLCYDAYSGKFFVGAVNQLSTILFFIFLVFDSAYIQYIYRQIKLTK